MLLEVFPAGSLFEETEQARDVVQSLALRLVEALDGVITDADGFLRTATRWADPQDVCRAGRLPGAVGRRL